MLVILCLCLNLYFMRRKYLKFKQWKREAEVLKKCIPTCPLSTLNFKCYIFYIILVQQPKFIHTNLQKKNNN